jgi:class 3 adenylate cyclase
VASVFAIILVTSAAERRNRRFVQEALGRYTSAALVKELMEHPEHLSLEWGERRGMSVYFSDIAGFTSFSENMPPEDLVRLLNDYLTHMTDLVLEHGGVVDKYIGDAVMAFWGAPIPNADHAAAAVRCAIAMRDRCAELRPGWKERYGVDVFARAGLSSGDAVVGNMGSKHKYNYTVMGDMVNLASRLEGANKAYGTALMISEACYAPVKDLVVTRELDLLAVKGKDKPVRVYEVFGEVGKVDAGVTALTAAFTAALAQYRARDQRDGGQGRAVEQAGRRRHRVARRGRAGRPRLHPRRRGGVSRQAPRSRLQPRRRDRGDRRRLRRARGLRRRG